MKKLKIFATTFIICISAFLLSNCISSYSQVKGNGILVTSEKIVSPFEKISSSGIAKIRVHTSNEYRVVVTVDSNIEEYIDIDTKNNTLQIGMKKGSFSYTKLLVDVYCPTLSSVSLSGTGSLEGIIENDDFTAQISGTANITVSGSSKNANIDVSGTGSFKGDEFKVNNATINLSGVGNVNVYVTDNLKSYISGTGVVSYRGNPASVDTKITGAGRIKKL